MSRILLCSLISRNMTILRTVTFLLLASAITHAEELSFDAKLQRAIGENPPGDYDNVWEARFASKKAPGKAKVPFTFDLLAYAEPSNKTAETLPVGGGRLLRYRALRFSHKALPAIASH